MEEKKITWEDIKKLLEDSCTKPRPRPVFYTSLEGMKAMEKEFKKFLENNK